MPRVDPWGSWLSGEAIHCSISQGVMPFGRMGSLFWAQSEVERERKTPQIAERRAVRCQVMESKIARGHPKNATPGRRVASIQNELNGPARGTPH